MNPIRITAVSYLNTFPFVYGLLKSPYAGHFTLDIAVPSRCAQKLRNGEADIALIPVGALTDFPAIEILPDFCIGAEKEVRTVLLLSMVPLNEISSIALDFDSRTSVRLVQVLASEYWKINTDFFPLSSGALESAHQFQSIVAIGDKTFDLVKRYPYVYDLACEWNRFTGLPFVFAVWAAVSPPDETTRQLLHDSLQYGIDRMEKSLDFFHDRLPASEDCLRYLMENISYRLDERKREGMRIFIEKMKEKSKKTGRC